MLITRGENMFNVEETTNKIVKFIQDYYKNNNLKGVVIGISGGKDSGVVAALFVKALGPENVIGVTMPCHSKESDKNDAKLVSDCYGFELINMDLTNPYDEFMKQVHKLGDYPDNYYLNSDINLKPRLRMSTLYYVAALYSEIKHGTYLVAGTGNKCEEYVGYFTKGGDQVSDIKVISDLTVSEVIKIGEYLNVPKEVLYKTPSDGLSGKSDEDKLGVKYSEIEDYMVGILEDERVKEKIMRLHNGSLHKFHIPTYINE
jgi:NAD+ synthase